MIVPQKVKPAGQGRRPGKIPSIVEFVTDPNLLGLSLSDAQETLLFRGV